jgi:hypothetical protein
MINKEDQQIKRENYDQSSFSSELKKRKIVIVGSVILVVVFCEAARPIICTASIIGKGR